jgi:hypothetical protein
MKKLEIDSMSNTTGGGCGQDAAVSCIFTAICFGGPAGLAVGVAMLVLC